MKKKLKSKVKIPPHCQEAMDELHDLAISLHDYADFLPDGKIIAYRRWGRGYIRDIIQKVE